MEKEQNIRLTSSEIAALHENYLGDSMSICVFKHFLATIEDLEIKPLIKHALDIATQHVETIKEIFTRENIAIPFGFTNADVNTNAQRLFSDSFYLSYLKHMGKGGLSIYGFLQPHMFHADLISFYTKCIKSTLELNNEATNLLLKKGLAVRPPYITYPRKAEFVKKQSFISGFFGDKRPLTGMEITHLYSNIQTNKLGEALAIGFSQVAKSNEVRKYFLRGKEISEKHIGVFGSYLRDDNLPVPMTWNHEVTESKDSPFSDKLMMFHFGLMNFSGVGNYGVSIAASQRSDLGVMYSRLMTEVLKYGEDGANILIDEGWLEQPPLAPDRDALSK